MVAGDAIKRELSGGSPIEIAAWVGPTKLANAILFATITNVVAYLPFLLLTGDTGNFLYSLPIVMTCTLVASLIVSMTFIPLLAYHLIRAPKRTEQPIEERRTHGFTGVYYRVGDFAIDHRWGVLAGSLIILAGGGCFMSRLSPPVLPQGPVVPLLRRRVAPPDAAAARDQRRGGPGGSRSSARKPSGSARSTGTRKC